MSFARRYQALIDTGATNSMVSSKVVRELSLPAIDNFAYSSASKRHNETTLHFVGLDLDPNSDGNDRFSVEVAKLGAYSSHFHLLIGMDVLSFYELKDSRSKASLKRLQP